MRIKPKKSLGQNFLNNTRILSNIVNAGQVSNKDIILEIGPGTGNLTEKIIDRNPKEFYVVEKDKDLSNMLKKRFGNKISPLQFLPSPDNLKKLPLNWGDINLLDYVPGDTLNLSNTLVERPFWLKNGFENMINEL